MEDHTNYFAFVVVITVFVTLIIVSVGTANKTSLGFGSGGDMMTGKVVQDTKQTEVIPEVTHGTITSTRIIFPTDRYDVISCFDDGAGNVVIEVVEKELQKPIKMQFAATMNEQTGAELWYECKAFKVLETETIVQ